MVFPGCFKKVLEMICQEQQINIYTWRKSFLSDILLTIFHFSCVILYSSDNHKQPVEVFYKKSSSEESTYRPATFLKNRLQDRRFPVNISIFLRTSIVKNIWKWLLLENIFEILSSACQSLINHSVPENLPFILVILITHELIWMYYF